MHNLSQYQHVAPERVASKSLNERIHYGNDDPDTLSPEKIGLLPSAPNPDFHESRQTWPQLR